MTEKVQGCRLNDNKSCTEAYRTHKDCEYGYKVICCYNDKYSKPIQKYENTVYKFIKKMLEEVEYCKGIAKLVMTENEKLCFKLMDKCHICVTNILTKMYVLETIVTLLENSGTQLTKNVI